MTTTAAAATTNGPQSHEAVKKTPPGELEKEQGNADFKAGRYRDAAQHYSAAIELEPGNASYWSNRAAAYVQLRRFNEAVEDASRAIACDAAFVRAFTRRATALMQLGRLDEAQSDSAKALALEPSNRTALEDSRLMSRLSRDLERASNLLHKQNNPTAACEILEKMVLPLVPDAVPFKLLAVECMIRLRRYEDASTQLVSVLQADPANIEAMHLRGLTLFYSGNSASAQKHFQEVLRHDPDNENARVVLKRIKKIESQKSAGNDAFTSGRYKEAVDLYSETINLDSLNDDLNGTLYCNRAAALMKLNKWEEAISDASKALELKTDYVKALIRRAQCYSQTQQWEEAVRDYERVLSLDRSNRDVSNALRTAKLELKKSKRKDYYKILGVPKDADESQIKKAYKLLALKWHPDKNNDSEEAKAQAEIMFKDVGEAYAVISDPQKRRRYDSGVDLEDDGSGDPNMADVDVNEIFSMFFGSRGGFGGYGGGPGSGFGGAGYRMHWG